MSNVTVRGTDGAVPQYDPEGRWTIFNYDELYFGEEASGKYVGKVNDLAYRVITNKYYRIVALDLATLIPTLQEVGNSDEETAQMLIGDGQQPVSFRLFLDTSKVPFEASIDSRHYIYGSQNTYARIFRGVDIGPSGKVISAVFNGSTYIDDKIPLELVAYDNHTNLAIKSVPSFNTRDDLVNGEVCTVVIYNAQTNVTTKKSLLVEKTSFIRPVNAFQRYITGIALESLFLSGQDPYTLNYPLNVPIGTLNLTGIVNYSDGSETRLAVDGVKFSIFGLNSFVATRPGQKVPLVLSYKLDPGEPVYGAVSSNQTSITESYTLVTTHENGLFSPILFGYPRWDASTSKYKLRWWLMDLNRTTLFDATNQVQFNESSDVFDGAKFNELQTLSIRIKLSDISVSLPQWIHTQTLYVKLYDPTLVYPNVGNWEVGQENVFGTFYGTDLQARVNTIDQNNFNVTINNNIATLDEWLNQMYYKARPVYALYRESKAPMPTHFTIINDSNNEQTFQISSWNQYFTIFSNISSHTNLIIRWDRQISGQILKLAVTELPINFIN